MGRSATHPHGLANCPDSVTTVLAVVRASSSMVVADRRRLDTGLMWGKVITVTCYPPMRRMDMFRVASVYMSVCNALNLKAATQKEL